MLISIYLYYSHGDDGRGGFMLMMMLWLLNVGYCDGYTDIRFNLDWLLDIYKIHVKH